MSTRCRFATALALGAMAPAIALAQPYGVRPEVASGPTVPYGYGSELALGGGVMNFAGAAAQSLTSVGGSWNLRLTLGTRTVVGFEGAYVGSFQKVRATGLDPNTSLFGNGLEGALRLNAPVVNRTGMVEPFALAGVGWTRFALANDSYNDSALRETNDVLTVPFGGGLAVSVEGFMFDARFTYRLAYNDHLLGGADMSNWVAGANIGREF